MQDTVFYPVADFPDKENLTHSELYREIANVESGDFSFAMTLEDFRWHKWLLANRRLMPSTLESVEHHEKDGLAANLVSPRPSLSSLLIFANGRPRTSESPLRYRRETRRFDRRNCVARGSLLPAYQKTTGCHFRQK